MRHLNKLLCACSFVALGLPVLTGCEGGELFDVNAPDWISDKVQEIEDSENNNQEDIYTFGSTDYSSAFWTEFSKYYVVPDGKIWTAEFELHIDPNATNTYKNFALVMTNDVDREGEGYKEYGVMRYDHQPSGNSEWGSYINRSYVQSTLTFETDTDEGIEKLGGKVTLTVDEKKRIDTAKNHSATHLLQEALRIVLGKHVEQAGSLVTPDRLRFDFTHFQPMTEEEIEKVEAIVNEQIAKSIDVETKVLAIEDAKKTGAKALFNEKYGDTVRVVCMGDFSKEFCGGTHVKHTGEIAAFKIISESGVAAGVRRIEALTGDNVFAYYKNIEAELERAAKAAKTTPAALVEKIEHMMAEIKALNAENESLKSKLAKEALGDVMDKVTEVKGVKLLAASVPDVDMNGLRDLGDQLKEKLGSGVVVLASAKDGKVSLLAMVTDDAMKKGAHAGKLIKEVAAVVGGGGGGRPNMAQAGGKNPAGIPDALAKVKEVLAEQIK